jgi:hypothetical protein
MYLEMLYNKYGSALEKQAMEKQALNPMQLVQMGRRFAAKGNLDRFGQLVAKRNNVIKNTDVFAKRKAIADDMHRRAAAEFKWLGHSGPSNDKWLSAARRTQDTLTPIFAPQYMTKGPERFGKLLNSPGTLGAVSPDELATWSSYLGA